MSYSREVTIWCDKCQHWEQASGITAAAFRKELRAKGWVSARGGQDYCPSCAKAQREGNR